MRSYKDVQILATLRGSVMRLSGLTDAPRTHANLIHSCGTGGEWRAIADSTMRQSAVLWAIPRTSIERARPPPSLP